jgi:type IV secretion system protein VirB2
MASLSYASAAPTDAIGHAINWWASLITGSLGTSIAVLAVAGLGFAVLRGEVSLRKAMRVILGCFILFGAPAIAQGLLSVAGGHAVSSVQNKPADIQLPRSPKARREANPFDPYAGEAVH